MGGILSPGRVPRGGSGLKLRRGLTDLADPKRLGRQSGTFVNPEPLPLPFEEYTTEFFWGKPR